jgi:hypothetical protein
MTKNFVILLFANEFQGDEMGGICSTNGEKRKAYRLLVGNHWEIDD